MTDLLANISESIAGSPVRELVVYLLRNVPGLPPNRSGSPHRCGRGCDGLYRLHQSAASRSCSTESAAERDDPATHTMDLVGAAVSVHLRHRIRHRHHDSPS